MTATIRHMTARTLTRRSDGGVGLLTTLVCLALLGAAGQDAWAAKKKSPPPKPVPAEAPPVAPEPPKPATRPPAAEDATPAESPPAESPPAVTPAKAAPTPAAEEPAPAPRAVSPKMMAQLDDAAAGKHLPRAKATFDGFFLGLNLGYASDGGEAGPLIPDMSAGAGEVQTNYGTFAQWRAKGCLINNSHCYNRAITTAKGSGLAADIQIGYNIKGYVSLWADLSWHGTFGATSDMAGVGTAAAMLGIHPLRFWRDDLPVDVRLYGGYGFFEIMYYYETEFQVEAKGKAWTGTSVPFGLHTELKIDRDGVFALGLDLRAVRGSYTKWIYNNDKDISSKLDSAPVETFRFEPRLTFGWHF